jgi:hypothetical protein
MAYDSREDTDKHIAEVRYRIGEVQHDLSKRMMAHDASKKESPELEIFDEFTPKLNASTYGSDEYKGFLVGMGKGLEHHYKHNDHHPEHFPGGIEDMNLLQLMEMLCDWKAATMRMADGGDLRASINQNAERFGYGNKMKKILLNTSEYMGWI